VATEQDQEERSLEPSERKLEKAREDGRFPQSRDLSLLLSLVTIAVLISLLGAKIWQTGSDLISQALQFEVGETPDQHLARWAQGPLRTFVSWLLISLLAVFLAGVLGPLSLSKFNPVFVPRFDLGRLDPLAGLGRLFSKQNLFALAKGVVVAAGLLLLSVLFFKSQQDSLMLAPSAPLPAAIERLHLVLVKGALWLLGGVALVAVVDATFHWTTFRNEMRMSLQEMKDEHKDSEGSPEIKARVRALQREASRRRMMAAVATADVVVVNPTHYAVALQYNRDIMLAPTVVAKGVDEIALRMRQVAAEHRVPIAESPRLARLLTAQVALDTAIPAPMYAIVAQVLAWAYASKAAVPTSVRLQDVDLLVPTLTEPNSDAGMPGVI
jgi:flagellar biosynthetic protein FlhB